MKIPLIKSTLEFISNNDEDFVHETIEVLEHISQAKGLGDEELNTIGELLSNFYGAIEVNKEVQKGVKQTEALNSFMKRVMGSIDT